MRPDVGEREKAMILEEVAVDAIGVGDRDDVRPVLEFGSLGDKVEEETESLRGAVEGRRKGLSRSLEELLADGRTHVERLIVRLCWRGSEGERRNSWCGRRGGSRLRGWLLGHG